MIVATSDGPRRPSRRSISASGTSAPRRVSSSSAPSSITNTSRQVGRSACIAVAIAAMPVVSAISSGRAAVGHDPLDLLGGRRVVDRHGDGAGREDPEVDHHPFEPGLAHQRHAVAGTDAGRGEPSRDRSHPADELADRDVDEAVALAERGDLGLWLAMQPFEHRSQDVDRRVPPTSTTGQSLSS